jgi:hypothetical protein
MRRFGRDSPGATASFHSQSMSQRRRPSAIPRPQPPGRVTDPRARLAGAEATTFLFKIAVDEARVVWCECGARRMSFRLTLSRNGL